MGMEFGHKSNLIFKKKYKKLKKKYENDEEVLTDLKALKAAYKNDIIETIDAIRYECGDY